MFKFNLISGSLFACGCQGSAIGEDVLLGLQEMRADAECLVQVCVCHCQLPIVQEHWPLSLRAKSDVKLAWLEASTFKEAALLQLSRASLLVAHMHCLVLGLHANPLTHLNFVK